MRAPHWFGVCCVLLISVVLACSEGAMPTDSSDRAALTPAGGNKVALCHRTGNGSYHSITVSRNAEPAHRAHGDGAVGDPVPGQDGMVFDENCVPVEVAQCLFEGSWSGIFNERPFTSYPIEVDFLGCVEPGEKIADVSYPTLPCFGDWTLNNYTVDGASVHEFPLPGCIEDTDYILTYDANTDTFFGTAPLVPTWDFTLTRD